jgi:putative solute:sodium symporter small subunit
MLALRKVGREHSRRFRFGRPSHTQNEAINEVRFEVISDWRNRMQRTPEQREYWQRNLKLTVILLGIWFVATFVVIWFARDLNELIFAGFPLAFYMGAQGSLIIYILIIWLYARRMNAVDKTFGVDEDE